MFLHRLRLRLLDLELEHHMEAVAGWKVVIALRQMIAGICMLIIHWFVGVIDLITFASWHYTDTFVKQFKSHLGSGHFIESVRGKEVNIFVLSMLSCHTENILTLMNICFELHDTCTKQTLCKLTQNF